MSWTVERKLLAGLLLAIGVFVVMAALSWATLHRVFATWAEVSLTQRVIGKLRTVLSLAQDIETGTRGYLITGDPAFLAPQTNACARLPAELDGLRGLTSGQPSQERELAKLSALLAARQTEAEEQIQLLRDFGLEAAADRVRASRGKQVMDELRAAVATMESEALARRSQNEAAVRSSTRLAIVTSSLTLLVATTLLSALCVTSLRDLRRRREAEAALRESENRLQTILDNTTALIFMRDLDGRLCLANRQYGLVMGREVRELIGRQPGDYVASASARRAQEHDREVLARGVAQQFEETMEHPDGPRTFVVVRFPMCDASGNAYAVGGVATDITERKRGEEALERLNEDLRRNATRLEHTNKELEAFSYSVSHDLRAPLRGIDGFSHVLLEDYAPQFDAEGRSHLQRIIQAANRMAELIDDLTKLARVSRSEINVQPVDVSALARDIASDLARRDAARPVAFVVQDGLTDRADPQLLRIALENLMDNAWKFTGQQTAPHIEVGRRPGDGEGVYFVRDNGAGFDMTYVDRLFGAFQRLHTDHDFPGTGIGLATVRRIIHRHGGRVWAEGKVNQGATFFFTLE